MQSPSLIIFGRRTKSFKIYFTFNFLSFISKGDSHQAPVIAVFVDFFLVDPYYNQTPYFDEKIVKTYSYPFGDMAREMVMESGMENFIDQKIV